MGVRKVGNRWEARRRDKWGLHPRRLFQTKKEAKKFDNDTKCKRGRGPRCSLTVQEFFENEIKRLEADVQNNDGRRGTVDKLKSIVSAMPIWLLETPLPKLTHRKCLRYAKHLQQRPKFVRGGSGSQPVTTGETLDPNTAATNFRTFTGHLQLAADNGLCRENVARSITICVPKTSKQDVDSMYESELSEFLYNASKYLPKQKQCNPEQMYVLLAVLALTGMRVGEARALQRWQVQLDHKGKRGCRPRIQIMHTAVRGGCNDPKTGRTRKVDVSPQLAVILRSWLGKISRTRTAWVFPAEEGAHTILRRRGCQEVVTPGAPIAYAKVAQAWRFVMSKDSFITRRLTLHSLRHTYATLLLNKGEDIVYVSGQLGHATIRETERTYAKHIRLEPSDVLRELDAALQLPDIPKEVEQVEQMVLPLALRRRPIARIRGRQAKCWEKDNLRHSTSSGPPAGSTANISKRQPTLPFE